MGHRAQYCIIREGQQSWFHSHWGAQSIAETVCDGPEIAEDLIRGETELPDGTGAFDNIWCEGGCVLDWDQRRLLLFDAEYLSCSRRRRETFLRLIAPLWPRWSVEWADRGADQLAEYAGNDPQNRSERKHCEEEWDDDDNNLSTQSCVARVILDLTRSVDQTSMPSRLIVELIDDAVERGQEVQFNPHALRDPAALTNRDEERLPRLLLAMRQAFTPEERPSEEDFQEMQRPAPTVVSRPSPPVAPPTSMPAAATTISNGPLRFVGLVLLVTGLSVWAGSLYVVLWTDYGADFPLVGVAAGPITAIVGGYTLKSSL